MFDLDGVLTTSPGLHAAAWADTFGAFFYKRVGKGRHQFEAFDEARDYESSIAGRPRVDGVRRFLASRGISLPEGSEDDPPGTASSSTRPLNGHEWALAMTSALRVLPRLKP